MGTASILGGKVRPGRVAAHSRPSSAAVMEEYSYTSHPLGHVGPVTVSLYLYCRYIRQNPASSNTVPPCGRMIYLYILPYNHTPIMECGPAQRESSSETTWRHCIIGSRRTQHSGPIFKDRNVQNLFNLLSGDNVIPNNIFCTRKRRRYGVSQRAERFGVRTPSDLHFSTVPGPNQPPVQWVPEFSWE